MGKTTARMIGQIIATVFQLHREKLKTGAYPRVTTAQNFRANVRTLSVSAALETARRCKNTENFATLNNPRTVKTY